MINVFQAPGVKNAAIIPLAVVFFMGAGQLGISSLIGRLVITVTIPAVIFGGLHGQRSLAFFVMAAVVMIIMTGLLYLGELGVVDLRQYGIGIVTAGMYGIGLHSGINLQATGGFRAYLLELWTAPEHVAFAANLVLGFEVLTAIIILVGLPGVIRRYV